MRPLRNPIDDDFRFYRMPSLAQRLFGPAVNRYLRPHRARWSLIAIAALVASFLTLWSITK